MHASTVSGEIEVALGASVEGTEILTGVLEATVRDPSGRGPDTRLIGGLTYQGVVGVGRATRPDFHACEASLKETGGS